MALTVAGCAAYFSVWGLSQLFAGASVAVIIMATILEISKVVTTTILHRHWSKLAIGLKSYLTIGVIVLMLITSAGIYGFLSNAYQSTANKLEIHEGELAVLDGKRLLFEKNINDNEKIITTKNKRIDQLSNLRSNQENRLDSAKNNRTRDKVRNDILIATNEIQKLSNDIDGLNNKNSILSDSVSKYNTKALELKSGSSVAAEVGPLKYIAELTGTPMAKVVNYLILLLIFVFDPLAIALILATNRVFELENEGATEGATEGADAVNDAVNDIIIPSKPEKINLPNVSVNELLTDETEPSKKGSEKATEEEKIIELPIIETPPPVKKIELEDIKEIKEIKENRGYSVPIPKNNNGIERIGSNKVIKNGDNNKFFFKKKQ
jgi:hypothetical protein